MLSSSLVTGIVIVAPAVLGIDISNVKRAMAELGMTASGFAASGLTPEASDEVLNRLKASSIVDQLIALRTDLREHETVIAECRRKLRDATDESQQQVRELLAERVAAAATTTAALKQVGDSLFADASSQLSQEQRDRLSRFRSTAGANLPAEFRVASLTADEIKSLQKALAAEARAAIRGESLLEEVRTVLVQFRERSDVATAKSALDTNLTAITQRFEQSLR